MPTDNPALEVMFGDLVRVETRLYNAINDRLRAQHGLFASQLEFLLYIRSHPKTRIAELARHFAIGIGATSKGIDRLESRELVQRVPNPDDGRSSLLELTATGVELVDEAKRTFDEQLIVLLGRSLQPTQRSQFAAALALLRAALEEANIGTPAG